MELSLRIEDAWKADGRHAKLSKDRKQVFLPYNILNAKR